MKLRRKHFVATFFILVAPFSNAEVIRLTCTADFVGGSSKDHFPPKFSGSFVIDSEAGVVNEQRYCDGCGGELKVTETEIAWRSKEDWTWDYRIDRTTGIVQRNFSDSAYYQGKCTPMSDKKF